MQSLEQSSLDVWSSGDFGRGPQPRQDGQLLRQGTDRRLPARRQDSARNRRQEEPGRRDAASLQAVWRRARIHSEAVPASTAQEIAGADLKEWFRKTISSTEELDYTEALDWFGLRFAPDPPPTPRQKQPARKKWKLEIREDSSDSQKAHLKSPYGARRQGITDRAAHWVALAAASARRRVDPAAGNCPGWHSPSGGSSGWHSPLWVALAALGGTGYASAGTTFDRAARNCSGWHSPRRVREEASKTAYMPIGVYAVWHVVCWQIFAWMHSSFW